MTHPTAERYDLLVVGGGPAGLAAAAQAADAGLDVGLVDERATLGGQIYKQPGPGFAIRDADALGRDFVAGRRLIDAVERRPRISVLLRTSAVDLRDGVAVLAADGEPARRVGARHVLLAPGAYDRPVAFPGWTLPGVLTAGGAQTLVKTQRVLPGRRLLFAGSGPLALAFPAQLRGYGVDVVEVLEAGPAPGPRDVLALAAAARGNERLLRDALAYRMRLLRGRVPLRYGRIVVRAEGEGRVEAVVHAAVDRAWRPLPGTEERIAVDALCVGYGFQPSVELLRLAGCAFEHDEDRGGHVLVRDEWLRTTVAGVSAAGDGTGVEGSIVAIAEGRLAALGAALALGALGEEAARAAAAAPRRTLRRSGRFRRALRRMHAVGPGVFELATPDTIVCRCEEVLRAQIDEAASATGDVSVVKALTRAGMGPCQGRNCERQVAALLARRHGGALGEVPVGTPRAPVRPLALGAIADPAIEDLGFFGDAD